MRYKAKKIHTPDCLWPWLVTYGLSNVWNYRTRAAARYAAKALNEAERMDSRTVAKAATVGQKGTR